MNSPKVQKAIEEVIRELKSMPPEEFRMLIDKAVNYTDESINQSYEVMKSYDYASALEKIVKRNHPSAKEELPILDTVQMLRES